MTEHVIITKNSVPKQIDDTSDLLDRLEARGDVFFEPTVVYRF